MIPSEHPMRELAIRLLSEAGRNGEDAPPAAQVLERLDNVLVRVAGHAGSRSLMERALSIARSEAPVLAGMRVPPAGSFLEAGWQFPATSSFDAENDQVILVSHVLQLLRTFIGERLTLQLIKEAWPDLEQNNGAAPRNHT